MRDGHQSSAQVYKPKTQTGPSPLVVLAHGGGFVMGRNTEMQLYARALNHLYNATVISISYRLAPEHKFPVAPYDIWDSLEWIANPSNSKTLGFDTSAGFVLGGVSAGGNLAATIAQMWYEEKKSPPLSGIWLSIPHLLEAEIVPQEYRDLWFSRVQNADALILNEESIAWIKTAYQPDTYSPYFSPFNSKAPHKGLPPVYLQVCGQDPLRDDALIYEKALRDNRVTTKLDVYPGVPHGHNVLFPMLKCAHKCNTDGILGFGWLLGEKELDGRVVGNALSTSK